MQRLGVCKIHNINGFVSVWSKAMVLLLLIHWLFVLSLYGVGVVIGPCYALLRGLSLLQSYGRGRIAGCFTLIVFLLALFFFVFGVLCLFLTMSWVGLQCVIVAFPGHTYLFLRYITHDCFIFFLISFT